MQTKEVISVQPSARSQRAGGNADKEIPNAETLLGRNTAVKYRPLVTLYKLLPAVFDELAILVAQPRRQQ